jgi:Mce-associated membrane protein
MSPQSSSRRRATPPQPPARRPRVAGLRKPGAPARPEEGNDTEIIPAVPPTTSAAPARHGAAPSTETGAPQAKPSPRPRRKPAERNRPSWEAAPRGRRADTSSDEDVADTATPVAAGASTAGRSGSAGATGSADVADSNALRRWLHGSGLLVPVVLGVVTVLLGGFAVFAGIEWHNLSSGDSAQNTAITDNAGTSEVKGEITSAVNTLFSYNYTDLAKTQNAVPTLLTGTALCQYNLIFKTVLQQAPTQKLVFTTTVVDSAVQMLEGDNARVLLVVDEHDTRATTNQSSDATAMFAVNAVRNDNKWQISGIDTFDQQQTQSCAGK